MQTSLYQKPPLCHSDGETIVLLFVVTVLLSIERHEALRNHDDTAFTASRSVPLEAEISQSS